jgi:hypothetical protein
MGEAGLKRSNKFRKFSAEIARVKKNIRITLFFKGYIKKTLAPPHGWQTGACCQLKLWRFRA